MTDSDFQLQGAIEICVFEGGQEVQRLRVHNKITYAGRNAFLLLLAQNALTNLASYKLVKLVPGTNNTPVTPADLGVLAPIAEDKQITLTDAAVTLNAAANELVITGTLPSGAGSGEVLQEAGLVLANGTLFARMTHPTTLPWAGTRSISYTWRVRAINP